MYERFTDKARKVMQLANYEAQCFNHEYIGTEHVLLGLIKEGSGVASVVLQNLHIHVRKIRREIERIVQPLPELIIRGKLPLTPRAKKVLEYAMEESRILNHRYVGTDHILLGLLREQDGLASQVLMNQGLSVADVREEILKLLGDGTEFISLYGPRWFSSPSPIPLGTPPMGCTIDPLQSSGSEVSALFKRFTDRARKVMQLANQEAQRFNHEYIGTEHILLGLANEGSGVAAYVLKALDVDVRKIRLEVEDLVQSGHDLVTGNLPLTPRAKMAIEYSMEEAFYLDHNYVGTEHVLLGLLREQEGVAAQILMNLGLKLEDVRTEVLNLLGHGL